MAHTGAGACLPAESCIVVVDGQLAHQARERELPQKQLRRLLVPPDLAEGIGARSVAPLLLDRWRRRWRCACCGTCAPPAPPSGTAPCRASGAASASRCCVLCPRHPAPGRRSRIPCASAVQCQARAAAVKRPPASDARGDGFPLIQAAARGRGFPLSARAGGARGPTGCCARDARGPRGRAALPLTRYALAPATRPRKPDPGTLPRSDPRRLFGGGGRLSRR